MKTFSRPPPSSKFEVIREEGDRAKSDENSFFFLILAADRSTYKIKQVYNNFRDDGQLRESCKRDKVPTPITTDDKHAFAAT